MTPFGHPSAFRLEVEVLAPEALDPSSGGPVRLIAVVGGRVTGSLQGAILPGGADWQTLRPDGTIEIEARYFLQLDDGTRVELVNSGLRKPDSRGFWSTIRLRCEAKGREALNQTQYVAFGQKMPDFVAIEAWALPLD